MPKGRGRSASSQWWISGDPGGCTRYPRLITDLSLGLSPREWTPLWSPSLSPRRKGGSLAASSTPESQAGYELPVSFDVLSLQIVQEATSLADHLQEPSARVVVLGMSLEVFGEFLDPPAQNCNLYLRRARIVLRRSVIGDEGGLLLFQKGHARARLADPLFGG